MSVCMRWLIAVAVLTIIMGCTPLPQAGAPTPSTTTFSITPVKAVPDDLDEPLGIMRWKFQLTLPQPTPELGTERQDDALIRLNYRLELRHAGHVPRVLAAFTDELHDPAEELNVIMFPIDYPDGQPERWKVSIHGGFNQVIDSPIASSQGASYSHLAERLPDGSFLLMEMVEIGGIIPSPDNPKLVFSVTEGKHP